MLPPVCCVYWLHLLPSMEDYHFSSKLCFFFPVRLPGSLRQHQPKWLVNIWDFLRNAILFCHDFEFLHRISLPILTQEGASFEGDSSELLANHLCSGCSSLGAVQRDIQECEPSLQKVVPPDQTHTPKQWIPVPKPQGVHERGEDSSAEQDIENNREWRVESQRPDQGQ